LVRPSNLGGPPPAASAHGFHAGSHRRHQAASAKFFRPVGRFFTRISTRWLNTSLFHHRHIPDRAAGIMFGHPPPRLTNRGLERTKPQSMIPPGPGMQVSLGVTLFTASAKSTRQPCRIIAAGTRRKRTPLLCPRPSCPTNQSSEMRFCPFNRQSAVRSAARKAANVQAAKTGCGDNGGKIRHFGSVTRSAWGGLLAGKVNIARPALRKRAFPACCLY